MPRPAPVTSQTFLSAMGFSPVVMFIQFPVDTQLFRLQFSGFSFTETPLGRLPDVPKFLPEMTGRTHGGRFALDWQISGMVEIAHAERHKIAE
jgi:hypothetical protein